MTLEDIQTKEDEITGSLENVDVNPIEKIGSNSTLSDFYDAILENGVVHGSSRSYSPIELIEKVDDMLRSSPDIKRLTSYGGVREAFVRVTFENENIEKNISDRLHDKNVSKAKSFGDLYAGILAHGSFIGSSGKVLDNHDALRLVESVRRDPSLVNNITRTGGLRRTVLRLLDSKP